MSRRHAPVRRWRVGDRCQTPTEVRLAHGGTRTYWQDAEVVAVRGERVVVRRYSWEFEHLWWELRPASKHLPWRRSL